MLKENVFDNDDLQLPRENSNLDSDLSLAGLNIESLEISDFLDDALAGDNELVGKVMAASCTTCECCCSCSG